MRRGHRSSSIDIGLAVLCAITPRDHNWSLEDIAEICECTRNRIWEIERSALRKLRSNPSPKLREFHGGTDTEARPPHLPPVRVSPVQVAAGCDRGRETRSRAGA